MSLRTLLAQARVIAAVLLAGTVASCGGDEDEGGGGGAETPTIPTPTPTPTPPTPGPTPTGDLSDIECELREDCQRRCVFECAAEERDRTDHFAAQRAKAAKVPFKMRVNRVYLEGECHSGGDPERRRDVDGVASIVEGTLTYTGDDVLYRGFLGGEMFLHFGGDQYREVFAAEKRRSYWSRRLISRFAREVRGEDPWRSGEARAFHWESRDIDPVFCEAMPQSAQAFIVLVTHGVKRGRQEHPVGFVNIPWDEVVGMAVNQPATLKVRSGRDWDLEPVQVRFTKQERALVKRASGKNEWVRRDSLIQNGDFVKAGGSKLPAVFSTAEWRVSVKGIRSVREFGGYLPDGEDEFLAVVDLELTYSPPPAGEGEDPAPGKLRGTSFRLETEPNRWAQPERRAEGQIDLTGELNPGEGVTGKVVFPRQRFERPFRLEVKTPDRQTSIVDIFSYDLGPERVVR